MKKKLSELCEHVKQVFRPIARRFLSIWRTRDGKIGIIIVSFLVLIAIFAPLIAPYDPYDVTQRDAKGLAPSLKHLLGTSITTGQDTFSMLLYGTRVSLSIGIITGLLIAVLGCLLGIVAGYLGGVYDTIIMRTIEVMQVIPSLPLTIVITNLFGRSYVVIVLVFVLFGWQSLARVVRSQVLTLKNSNYVKAAKLNGASSFYIMRKHILPGIYNLVIMSTALTSAGIMLAESGLSFLGLGNPNAISWGKMLADSQSGGSILFSHYWDILAPGFGIFLSVFGFMRIGLALESSLNPKMRKKSSLSKIFLHLNNRYLDKVFEGMKDNSGIDISSLKPEKEKFHLFQAKEKKEKKPKESPSDHLLEVNDLKVVFPTPMGLLRAVEDISFYIDKGEAVGLVGESGSGKSVTASSIMRLLDSSKSMTDVDKLSFEGKNLLSLNENELSRLRGKDMSLIFQNALTSLDPVISIGKQMDEIFIRHQHLSRKQAKEKTLESLKLVGLSDPERRYKEFPHNLSGGMRQRVMIAMAFALNPKLIIADEPTTALDATVQNQIISILSELQKKRNTSLLLVSHDLAVVYHVTERIYIMYCGKIVEEGKTEEVFKNPYHPYTKLLLSSATDYKTKEESNGFMPDPIHKAKGCYFCSRCPYCKDRCRNTMPSLVDSGDGRKVRCFFYKEIIDHE